MDVKLLNEIEYGPFKAKYHQENTNLEFKEALINFLRDNIVPQVTIKFDRVEGNLLAVYDEDIYCGSHSLVKNIYDLDLSFIKGEENEFLREDIVYNPKLISFSVRGKRKLYLWTVERQKKAKYKEIKNICISFLEEDIILVEKCPICSAKLRFYNKEYLVYVSCPNSCFIFNCRRSPETGKLFYGVFDIEKPD